MNYVQTAFAPEHRTPPLPLIALIGCAEVHRDVGDYFVQTLRPPLVSLMSAEPLEQFVPRAFGPGKMTISLGPPAGILKVEWFAKHRSKKPAVALAFVTRAEFDGDPSTWNRMLYALKLIRDATQQRGAGLVVAVIGPAAPSGAAAAAGDGDTELLPDRVAAICHNLSLEPRLLCSLSGLVSSGTAGTGGASAAPADDVTRQRRDGALAALGRLLHEQCMAYYLAQSQRVERKAVERAAAEQPNPPPLHMVARTAFKLAVLAEFRQDWEGAVRHYSEAYHTLLAIPLGSPLDFALYVEVLRVTELVHLKTLMLLQHQGSTEEALGQARRHLAWVGTPPGVEGVAAAAAVAAMTAAVAEAAGIRGMDASVDEPLPPAAAAWHFGMVARQHQLTSEVVGAKLASTPLEGAHRDLTRPMLLMAAACAAVARRRVFEALRQQRSAHPLPIDGSAVRKGAFVGQVTLRRGEGASHAAPLPRLCGAEYLLWMEYEELRSNTPTWCVELLAAAALLLRDSRSERLRSQLGLMLAAEHVQANNLSAARKLLLQAAHTYRREGWELPLVTVLGTLREVSQRLRMPAEHLVYCLELAVLASQPRRTAVTGRAAASVGSASTTGTAADGASASSSPWVTDPQALQLCRAALATLATGVSDIKQGIMKQLSVDRDRRTSHEGATDAGASASGGAGASASSASSGRSFHYVVEHTDLPRRSPRESDPGGKGVAVVAGAAAAPSQVGAPPSRGPSPDFGWWRCIAVAPAFRSSPTDPEFLDFCLGLQSQLPVALPLRSVTVRFADDQGEWDTEATCSGRGAFASPEPACAAAPLRGGAAGGGPVHSAARGEPKGASSHPLPPDSSMADQDWGPASPGPASTAGGTDGRGGGAGGALDAAAAKERGAGQGAVPPGGASSAGAAADGGGLILEPGRWAYASVRLTPRCIGRVRCETVTLQVGEHSSVAFRVSSFPDGAATLGDRLRDTEGGTPFRGLPPVLLGVRAVNVAHVGPLPTVRVESLPTVLLGEFAPLRLHITTRGALRGASVELAIKTTGITPADLSLIVDAGGTLVALSPESNRVALPELAADATHHVRAWLQCRAPGRVLLAALLSCPAMVQHTVEMTVEEPFEHKCRLSSECGVHTLTLPKPSDAGLIPLTIGQPAMLAALVRALQPGRLQLVDAQVEVVPGSGLMPVCDLRQQLLLPPPPPPTAGRATADAPSASSSGGGMLSKGDVHAFNLPVVPTRLSEGGVALGRVRLAWRRLHDPAVGAWAEAAPSPLLAEAAVTYLDLPHVSVQESVLTARTFAQAQATAGIAFSYSLQVQNFSAISHELSVSLLDAPGFVLSGERTQAVLLPVRESATVVWLLVAHTAAGHLALPAIRVTVPRINCALTTQSAHIYVLPF